MKKIFFRNTKEGFLDTDGMETKKRRRRKKIKMTEKTKIYRMKTHTSKKRQEVGEDK